MFDETKPQKKSLCKKHHGINIIIQKRKYWPIAIHKMLRKIAYTMEYSNH